MTSSQPNSPHDAQRNATPTCRCGHLGVEHRQWWDIGDAESNGGPSCGMGCDLCPCDDFEGVYA